MYKFEEFVEIIRKELKRELGEQYSVDVEKVTKNNGMQLTGIIVRNVCEEVSPCIYAEPLFKYYSDKVETMDEIIQHVKEVHIAEKRLEVDLEKLIDYSSVKEKLFVTVVNYEANKEMLSETPHMKIVDLAVVYRVHMGRQEGVYSSIKVNNTLLSGWGVPLDQLHKDAVENTVNLFPVRFARLIDVLGLTDVIDETEEDASAALHMLSNVAGVHGSAVLTYPGLLKRIAESFNEREFFILPSSIHELLVLAQTGNYKLKDLIDMVREVNSNVVATEDILSDNVYLYDADTDALRIVAA